MRIFVNARFLTQPLSGVQRYGIECSRQIKNLSPDTVFLAPHNIFNKNAANDLGVKIIGTHTGHLWEQYDLPAYLSQHGDPPLFSPANTAPLFYKNNYLTLHDLAFFYHPEWNSRFFSTWYNFVVPKLIKKSKHIFTVSHTIEREIIAQYHVLPAKLSVTYNGIAQDMLSSSVINIFSKEKIILSVGSFNVRKNHHNLIEAFIKSGLKDTYQLVIIGDKNKVFKDTSFNEQILADNNINLYNKLSDAELIEFYQKAEVLVSLSVYEGFGIPLLEGLFYNCKVLCSNIPVYRELFNNYASFCDPHDIDSISIGLKRIAGDVADSSNEFTRAALLQKFSYKASAKIITEIMQKD